MGERVQWYELPEADKEVVDSRIGPETEPPGPREVLKPSEGVWRTLVKDKALLRDRCPRVRQVLPQVRQRR